MAQSQTPKRIIKESLRLKTEKIPGITVHHNEANIRHFVVEIEGPVESPYEGGTFCLEVYLPHEYPMSPPKVYFVTKLYHPNIDNIGRICLDILKAVGIIYWIGIVVGFFCYCWYHQDKWSPALQIRTVLLSIQALLSAPNPDDPLNNNVAEQWKTNESFAMETARQWTKLYATQPIDLSTFNLNKPN